MRKTVLLVFIATTLLHACIVHGPKYTRVERVLQLEIGMTEREAEKILELRPYDLKSIDSAGNRTVIYKYRVTDRKTVPFLLKDTNGREMRGKFVDLYLTFNKRDTLISLETHHSDSELREKRLNINTLLTFLTVTVPAVMIYLGLKTT